MDQAAHIVIRLSNESSVYFPGDFITGNLELKVASRPIAVQRVSICFRGKAVVCWREDHVNKETDDTGKRFAEDNICHRSVPLFHSECNSSPTSPRPIPTHERGWYTYPFRIKIGKGLFPSSFECQFGAIRYWLKGKVVTNGGVQTTTQLITVLEKIFVDRENAESEILGETSLCCLESESGSGFLSADIDHESYCPGEEIAIKCYSQQKGGPENSPLTGIKATLTQTVKLNDGDSHTKVIKTEIARLESGAFGRNERFWQDQRLEIPPISSTTKCSSFFAVSFAVKIILTISKGYDLAFRLPITIGTVPRNITRESGNQTTIVASTPQFCRVAAGMQTFHSDAHISQFPTTMDFLPASCMVTTRECQNGDMTGHQLTPIKEGDDEAGNVSSSTRSDIVIHVTGASDDDSSSGRGHGNYPSDSSSCDELSIKRDSEYSESDDVFEQNDKDDQTKVTRKISKLYFQPRRRAVSIM